jgi:hypothetical protein
MRLLRFRCDGCGLEMALEDKPEKCFCCGSTNIRREGWRLRFSSDKDRK